MTKMKNKKRSQLNIDVLLESTWLQVVSLYHGAQFQEGEGLALWQRCVSEIERVQAILKDVDFDDEDCQHILYAQCALLDEVVKGRGEEDDAYEQWYQMPLQGHFFGSIDAGELLFDRIRQVISDPAANQSVLTCFHRVLMLGFTGSYADVNDPQRLKLIQQLSQSVPHLPVSQEQPLVQGSMKNHGYRSWFSSWTFKIIFTLIVLAALWWGLDHWLDLELIKQMPIEPS